ncbi:hypothetical protein ACTJK5_10570 [Agrobacterium sp. 22094]|uniref:hypothetical protein n=1 Tax=Agrobacterium sp. 22094 TaxID=3453872 RepID=UPI003F85CCFA
MTETDLTPRQAVSAYLGDEAVAAHVLRAAIAQYLVGYEQLVDLASDLVNDPEQSGTREELASELVMQQTMLEEFYVLTAAATSLPDLVRSRTPSQRTRA